MTSQKPNFIVLKCLGVEIMPIRGPLIMYICIGNGSGETSTIICLIRNLFNCAQSVFEFLQTLDKIIKSKSFFCVMQSDIQRR